MHLLFHGWWQSPSEVPTVPVEGTFPVIQQFYPKTLLDDMANDRVHPKLFRLPRWY